MENVEITESRLLQSGYTKVGNTFYRNKHAVTHFENKFQIWADADYRVIKTMQELQVFSGESVGIKKPG